MIQWPIEDFYFFKKTIDEKGLSRPNSATLVEHQSIEVSRSLNFQYFARHALKKFCCVFCMAACCNGCALVRFSLDF
jgi:hypothetical protein